MPEQWAEIVAVLIGGLVTVLWRVIDKYLPDDDDRHPLPPRPGTDDAT